MNPGDSVRVSFEEDALLKAAVALRTTAGGAMRKAKQTGDTRLLRKATDAYHTARMLYDALLEGSE